MLTSLNRQISNLLCLVLLSSMEGAINIVNNNHVKTDNGGLLIDCWAFTQKIRRSIILNLVGDRKLCWHVCKHCCYNLVSRRFALFTVWLDIFCIAVSSQRYALSCYASPAPAAAWSDLLFSLCVFVEHEKRAVFTDRLFTFKRESQNKFNLPKPNVEHVPAVCTAFDSFYFLRWLHHYLSCFLFCMFIWNSVTLTVPCVEKFFP